MLVKESCIQTQTPKMSRCGNWKSKEMGPWQFNQVCLFVCFLKIDGLDTEFLKSLSVTSNETSNMNWVKRKRGIY